MESFEDYKKTLEGNLNNISYLYSGDIISSTNSEYTEDSNICVLSPSIMIRAIDKIYKESFDILFDRTKKTIVLKNKEDIYSSKLSIFKYQNSIIKDKISDCKYFFTNKYYISTLEKRPFPDYFYNARQLGLSELYHCPFIKDQNYNDTDDTIYYVTNKPIQSIVYSIQNMDYIIESVTTPNIKNKWRHTLKYKIYECDYTSNKIVFRNLAKIREARIDSLLN